MNVKKTLLEFLYKSKTQPHEYRQNEYGFKEFVFKENDFIYWDRYTGEMTFGGQEIVFYKSKPIWIANYWGQIFEKKLYNHVNAFLRKVLNAISEEIPIRGPERYQELIDNTIWSYEIIGVQSLEKFKLTEVIKINNQHIYKGYVHGGILK